jgi:hypothetical protein
MLLFSISRRVREKPLGCVKDPPLKWVAGPFWGSNKRFPTPASREIPLIRV